MTRTSPLSRRTTTIRSTPEYTADPIGRAADTKQSWNLERGATITDGRTVLEPLGGGRRYEVFLVWDERLLFPAIAKVLRPDRVEDERAVRALRREAGFLERLAHPILIRGFDAVLDGRYPHLLLEHVDGGNLRELISSSSRGRRNTALFCRA